VLRVGPPPPGDFDGDGRAEIAVFRPSTGVWYVRGVSITTWGGGADIPVAGDYDGDGKTDVAVYRPSTGTWFVLRSSTDYTLFTTLGDASAVPCLQLDRRQPALGERLYVPQYPWGAPLKIAIWSDSDAGGWCSVVPIPWVAGNLAPQTSQIGYFCDTAEGSLGAPVLSGSTHRVVGIHHIGLCPNAASRMDLIWPQIAGLADDCSNGYACEPVSGDRCNCDGACSGKERRYIDRGGLCADCWEEPAP